MQTVQVDATGVARTLTSIMQVDATGVARTLKQIWMIGPDGVARQIFSSAPPVSVSPDYVSGTGYSKNPITISTSATTVTAPIGATFAWNVPAPGWSAINPTSASTGFRKITVGAGVELDTTFTCTVTLPGGSVTTVTVAAEVSNNYASLE